MPSSAMAATARLPRFAAPADGHPTPAMHAAYARDGVLVLEDFVDAASCERLIAHTLRMVAALPVPLVCAPVPPPQAASSRVVTSTA